MKIILLDTETTGLISPNNTPLELQPKIIEFYGVRVDLSDDEFKIEEEVDEIIDPGEEISATITRITGLENKDLKGKPTFADIAPKIEKLYENTDIAVAHNIAFDNGMLENEFSRVNKERPKAKRDICTVEATMAMKGFRLSLIRLHGELFGTKFTAHRAKEDVFALMRCFNELLEKGIIKL